MRIKILILVKISYSFSFSSSSSSSSSNLKVFFFHESAFHPRETSEFEAASFLNRSNLGIKRYAVSNNARIRIYGASVNLLES